MITSPPTVELLKLDQTLIIKKRLCFILNHGKLLFVTFSLYIFELLNIVYYNFYSYGGEISTLNMLMIFMN